MTAAERADHDQVEQTTGKPGAATDSSDDESRPPETVVRFAVVCHICRTALPLPATGSDHDSVADALDDESEAVFLAVVA